MKSIRFATLAIALPLSIPVMAQMAATADKIGGQYTVTGIEKR